MALLQAYRATRYRVWLDKALCADLRIDAPCGVLDEFLRSANATQAAFLTACNPRSQPLSAAENAARMEALQKDLSAKGFSLLPGLGIPVDSDWTAEESVLVMGMSPDLAVHWAERFEQLALVHHQRDRCSELILTPLYRQHMARQAVLREPYLRGGS